MVSYCESVFETKRWKTREVKVGKVGIGGDNPVRIQSMTTSSTRDIDATVDQAIRLADAGCEIVRVTVQGKKEAEACEGIKNGLVQRGYDIPLVADIHFYPPAAMLVADFVDKVRVNPGNFADKRASFQVLEYSDADYEAEIQKIRDKFCPLVEKCQNLDRAIRIGTNHGSLSDRIMNRYGDSPAGMVESALEYARICREMDFHNFLFSMKSSNPQVMIHAYRLLVARMRELGWDYPLHLGVTEAGEGEDGRVKSAMGIGSLLMDGIGDTVRVSLTEDPWHEIDPCQRLVKFSAEAESKGIHPFEEKHRKFNEIRRRRGEIAPELPLHQDGTVLLSLHAQDLLRPDIAEDLGFENGERSETAVDAVILEDAAKSSEEQEALKKLQALGLPFFSRVAQADTIRVWTIDEAQEQQGMIQRLKRFSTQLQSEARPVLLVQERDEATWALLKELKPSLVLFRPVQQHIHYSRLFFEFLQESGLDCPVILDYSYSCDDDDLVIHAATECGALLCDGLGDGVCITGRGELGLQRRLGFQILQSARMRTFKTEFISCPSCGRTLFDLQTVTRQIRERTGHLPGVKIAVMGCIVNGPGEMADADFGYVGSAAGKIDLYVGKEKVEPNIPQEEGPDRLVELLKKHGRWVEPKAAAVR